MKIIQHFKYLSISMLIIIQATCQAYANLPIITDYYPRSVNLDQKNSTLIIKGAHLESPLTITINETVIPVTNNSNPSSVTCIIPGCSTPELVTLTVQNYSGTTYGHLEYKSCSSFITIDGVLSNNDIIEIKNDCYSRYQYKMDSGEIIDIPSGSDQILLEGLEDGVHFLTVTGYDQAFNMHAQGPVSFTMDSSAPDVIIQNIPTQFTTNTGETIHISTQTDATHYQYLLNNQMFTQVSLSEPLILTSLTPGAYTLYVFGCDKYNNCQTMSDVSPVTWTVVDIAFAENTEATQTTILEAGTQSGVYSVNCIESDISLEWFVSNYDGDQIGDTVFGNTFAFTAPDTGGYAGSYTVNMLAKVDDQIIKTMTSIILVPFTIESDQYNIVDETTFHVKGVETDATFIWNIVRDSETPSIISDLSDIGTFDRTDPKAKDKTFFPGSVDGVTPFRVKVTIENNPHLNGLLENTTETFVLIPSKNYTITISDEWDSLSTTTINDVIIKELVLGGTRNVIPPQNKVVFNLPASGGTYYFYIQDNRPQPIYSPKYFRTTSRDSFVVLQRVGDADFTGTVTDSNGNAIKNATVTAYHAETDLSLFAMLPTQYHAQTDSQGQYVIYLPEYNEIGGWTLIAGKDGYVSSIKTDQQANSSVLFSGNDALTKQTQIMRIWTVDNDVLVQADPPFENVSEIDIRKLENNGEKYISQQSIHNGVIQFAKPASEHYTLIINADTIAKNDPQLIDPPNFAYRIDSPGNVLARRDKTLDPSGGSVSLENNNHVARVEIPANGITESATISIEQLENTIDSNAAMGIKYIYAVHATHVESGRSLNYDQINQIAITLSFDLSLIRPGDLENSQYHVYRADTLEQMNSHQTERISNIRQSDYLGDGKMGSVTVWVDRLSFFAIGKPPDISAQQFEESQLIDEGGGDCFIGVLR